MRSARRALAVAACVLFAASARAQEGRPAAEPDRIAPWTRLLGDWASVDPSGAPGPTRMTCERGTGPHLLRIVTRRAPEGRPEETILEGFVYWHPGRQAYVREEFTAWGSIHDGLASVDERAITYDFASFERDGTKHARQVITFTGADSFTFKVEEENAAGWTPRSEASFRRVVPAR